MVDVAAFPKPGVQGFMQVLAELSSPSNWTALQSLFAAVLLLIVLGSLGAFVLRKVLHKDEEQSRIDAEQIAVMVAGNMVARSPEEGDRLSLKERNSIKALIGEAVLSLREHKSWAGRRAIEQLKAADPSFALEIFADIAEVKRVEADKAAREASAALRHQGALTLPSDTRGALALFQQAFELNPHDAANLLALAVVQFRLGDIPSVEALIAEARTLAQGSREDVIGLIDMFAGVLNVRGGRLEAAIEKFENAKRIFEALDEPRALVDALMTLASAQMKAGNLDGALANYGAAQVLCTKNDYQLGLAQLHADLGLLLQSLGRFPDAEQMLLKSFSIADKLGEIAIASVAPYSAHKRCQSQSGRSACTASGQAPGCADLICVASLASRSSSALPDRPKTRISAAITSARGAPLPAAASSDRSRRSTAYTVSATNARSSRPSPLWARK